MKRFYDAMIERWIPWVTAMVLIVLAVLAVGLLAVSCKAPITPAATPAPTTELEAEAVRAREAMDTREDSWIYWGGDIRFYTDDHATESHRIDGGAGLIVAAPTAIATATPAAVIDNDGVSNILEVRDAATPVFTVRDGGTLDIGNGAATFSGTALDLNDSYIDQDVGTENIGILPSLATSSITYTAAAGVTGTLFTIGDGEIWIVHGMWVNVTENFDATGDDATLVIGDGNDEDGFCVLADAELQAADTEATGFAAGWQCMAAATRGVYLDEVTTNAFTGGFIYAPSGAAETIDYLIDEGDGETLAGGAATIYVLYTRAQ